ncbi:hypothetical protein D9M71_661920 [compost metagenome]
MLALAFLREILQGLRGAPDLVEHGGDAVAHPGNRGIAAQGGHGATEDAHAFRAARAQVVGDAVEDVDELLRLEAPHAFVHHLAHGWCKDQLARIGDRYAVGQVMNHAAQVVGNHGHVKNDWRGKGIDTALGVTA